MSTQKTDPESRLVELETRLAFQDDNIQALNETVARQQNELAGLQQELEKLKHQVRALTPENIADEKDETPPPHY